jgi:hypothetical protein
MSVLETFYILFKSDTDDLVDGSKKAEETTDKLEESLSGVDKESVEVGKSFNKLATSAVAAFAGVFAVTSLISSSKALGKESQDLSTLSEILGMSTENLTAYSRAIEVAGGSSDSFKSSLSSLHQGLVEGLQGSEQVAAALRQIGVEVTDSEKNLKSLDQLLPQISDGLNGLSKEDALLIGQDLGFSPEDIIAIRSAEGGLSAAAQRQKDLMLATGDSINEITQFTLAMKQFGFLIDDIATQSFAGLIPSLKSLINLLGDFSGWVSENEELVLSFFTGLGVALGALAIKVAIATLPFTLMAAAIGVAIIAIGAIARDIYKFATGQESVIGKMAEKWEWFVDSVVGKIAGIFSAIASGISSVFGAISNLKIPSFIAQGVVDWFSNTPSDAIEIGQNLLGQASSSPIAGMVGGASSVINNSSSSNSNSPMVINGGITVNANSNNPDEIGQAVVDMLAEYQNAQDSFDDGVLA